MLKPLRILGFQRCEGAPKLGAGCRCPGHARISGVARTSMPSPDFVLALGCAAFSVIRKRGSSPWSGGEKNGVRCLRDGAAGLVRPAHAASSRPVLWRYTGLPRTGGAPGSLSALWQGEARATGFPGRQSVLHEAIRLLRRPALSQCHGPGRGVKRHPVLRNKATPSVAQGVV